MIDRERQNIREDGRSTINEVSMLVGIIHGTCHKILTEDLKMRRCRFKVRAQTPECRPKTATT